MSAIRFLEIPLDFANEVDELFPTGCISCRWKANPDTTTIIIITNALAKRYIADVAMPFENMETP